MQMSEHSQLLQRLLAVAAETGAMFPRRSHLTPFERSYNPRCPHPQALCCASSVLSKLVSCSNYGRKITSLTATNIVGRRHREQSIQLSS